MFSDRDKISASLVCHQIQYNVKINASLQKTQCCVQANILGGNWTNSPGVAGPYRTAMSVIISVISPSPLRRASDATRSDATSSTFLRFAMAKYVYCRRRFVFGMFTKFYCWFFFIKGVVVRWIFYSGIVNEIYSFNFDTRNEVLLFCRKIVKEKFN